MRVVVPLALYRLLPDGELCVLPQTGRRIHSQHPEWRQAIVVDCLARAAQTCWDQPTASFSSAPC